MTARTFQARYPGRCLTCDKGIEIGDLLRYDEDDVVVHAECATASRVSTLHRAPERICPSCHLTLPCDCEEAS